MGNYVTKKELRNYLFNLRPHYNKSAIPPDIEKIIAQGNRDFREGIWKLILSDDILSLCNFSPADGLKLKLHNRSRKIKDDKLFIALIFTTLNDYYFEYHAPIYKYTAVKKMQKLSNLYDELEIIENGLSKTSTYKTDKKKRNIPREDTRKNLRKKFKARINNVLKEVINTDFDKIFWTQTRKRNEKIIINLLYNCFKLANSNISQQDICYCIAKVTLIFGTHLRSQTVRNYEPITLKMISNESERVEQIYRRFNKVTSVD